MDAKERKKKFKELYNQIPGNCMARKVELCAKMAMITESSVRVYISKSNTNVPSIRTLQILERAIKLSEI